MAASLFERFPAPVGKASPLEVLLVPSSGGVFEVDADGTRLFSKKALGRHAEPGEIEDLVARLLA